MDAPVKALNTEKAKALQAALAQIEKQFGKGTIMRLGEGEVIDDIEVVSTGSLGLDIALGVGGLARLGQQTGALVAVQQVEHQGHGLRPQDCAGFVQRGAITVNQHHAGAGLHHGACAG